MRPFSLCGVSICCHLNILLFSLCFCIFLHYLNGCLHGLTQVGTLPPLLASDCARLLKRGLGDAGGGLSFEACAKVAHSNSGMSRIRAVIFDVGGVLTPSPFEALTAWEKAHNLPPGYATAALGASSVAPQTTAAVTAAISSSSSPASSSSSVFAALERGERRPDDAACADLALQMSSPSAIARYLKLSVREKNRTSASSAEAFAKAASAAVAAAALDSSKVVALLQMMAAPIAQGPIHAIAEVVGANLKKHEHNYNELECFVYI